MSSENRYLYLNIDILGLLKLNVSSASENCCLRAIFWWSAMVNPAFDIFVAQSSCTSV